MSDAFELLRERKSRIRREAEMRLAAMVDRDAAGRAVWDRFLALPECAAAQTVMVYVHFGVEVPTREFLPELWSRGKRVVVPYCTGDDLSLFLLERFDDLSPGRFRILEPCEALRRVVERHVAPDALDVVLTPGTAFDRRGGRVGRGRGYYDRLLRRLRPDAFVVGAAFECQMVDEAPMSETDVFMDRVVTESATYVGRGRTPVRNEAASPAKPDSAPQNDEQRMSEG